MKPPLLPVLFLLAAPATASGQNYSNAGHVADCTRSLNTETEALKNDQWERLVEAARQSMSVCHDLFRGDDEAGTLADIAMGLNMQGRFADSLPISTRCLEIKPDAAFCYLNLGESYEGLGRVTEAKNAYRQAIGTGGYDRINASAIERARKRLANIPADDPKVSEAPGENKKFGTGFMVTTEGHILTNNHVVSDCRTVTTRDGKPLKIVSTNAASDLALLRPNWSQDDQKLIDRLRRAPLTDGDRDSIWHAFHTSDPEDVFVSTLNKFGLDDAAKEAIRDLWSKGSQNRIMGPVAVFRTGQAPKLGDMVVAFGFPLPGLLSSEGNVSTGILSATSGLQNDARFIQISAPIQPGNSGGPLFDSSGHVIGVVVAKLDAVKMAQITGDIPQNVNFAVQWSQVRAFLNEAGVPYQKEVSQRGATTRSIAAAASRIAVAIECTP